MSKANNNDLMKKVRVGLRAAMLIHNNPVWKTISLLTIGAIFCTGIFLDNYNISVLALDLLLTYNVWYFLGAPKKRILFFIMNFSIFLFLLSRPTIGMIQGREWWYFSNLSVWKSLLSLLLVLLFLNLGFCHLDMAARWQSRQSKFTLDKSVLRKVCFVLFLIGFFACMYQEIPRLLYAMREGYVSLYGGYTDYTAAPIRILATMMPYFLMGYLATFPEKRRAFVPLALYTVSGLPIFIAGARNDLMIKLVFVFLYYCLRDVTAIGKDIWIGKIERALLIILIPVLIIGLGVLNFARDDEKIKQTDGNIVTSFFYLQGTSFDTVGEAFEHEEELRSSPYVTSYVFGGLVDYVKHGTVAQLLFGAEDLGSGNSIENATKSNSLAHHLSYLVLDKSYLDGHGRGSSFIAETYIDFGFTGIIIYTLLLGMGLRAVPSLLKRSWLAGTFVLISISNLFLISRVAALYMLDYLYTIQFWLAMCMILFFYFMLRRVERKRGIIHV